MDGRRHETLSDGALDRELEAAFAVEPSPSFLAKTRGRIDAERLRASHGRMWMGACGTVAVVVVVAVTLWRADSGPSISIAQSTRAPIPVIESPPPLETPASAQEPRPEIPDAGQHASARTEAPAPDAGEPPSPAVVISEAEVRGFAVFLRQAREGRVLPTGREAETPVRDLVIAPIDIPPLAIEPLGEIARLDVGGQP